MSHLRTLHNTLVTIGLAVTVSACASVGPEYERPELTDVQDAWFRGDSSVLSPGAIADARWWEEFEDPTLIGLVEDAAAQNFDLAEALARIDQAEAGLAAAQASRFPLGNASASVTRAQQSEAAIDAGGFPIGVDPTTTYGVGASVSWEADLFGRVSNAIAQADASLSGQAAVADDLARIIVARTASTYLALRELDVRLQVNQASLERQEEVLGLTRTLRDAGQVSDLDVARQANLVENTRAGLLAIRRTRAETLSSLALLTGRTVPDLVDVYPVLGDGTAALSPVTATRPIAIGTPEALLRRRPDIRAAERQLAASVIGVKLATAELYPSLTLTGSAQLSALEPGEILSAEAFGYSFGPSLSWGVFNLGLTRAQIDQREAEAEAARINFERTVVSALTETDAALETYNLAVEEAILRGRAREQAERALELVDIRYREGAESLLSLIDAQRQALAAEDSETQARYEALRRRVAVYQALGG